MIVHFVPGIAHSCSCDTICAVDAKPRTGLGSFRSKEPIDGFFFYIFWFILSRHRVYYVPVAAYAIEMKYSDV